MIVVRLRVRRVGWEGVGVGRYSGLPLRGVYVAEVLFKRLVSVLTTEIADFFILNYILMPEVLFSKTKSKDVAASVGESSSRTVDAKSNATYNIARNIHA